MTQYIPAATLRRMNSMYYAGYRLSTALAMIQGTPDEDLELFMNAVRDWRTYHEAVTHSKAN